MLLKQQIRESSEKKLKQSFTDVFQIFFFFNFAIFTGKHLCWGHFLTKLQTLRLAIILKNFAIFTGKHLCWSPFLIKLEASRPVTLLKSDSNIGGSSEYCEIFKNRSSYRTLLVAASKKRVTRTIFYYMMIFFREMTKS